jgi:hypothetical protein
MSLVSGADLRRLRIPYERITVYKITVPSAKNDVIRKLSIGKLSEFIRILTANCCAAILRPFSMSFLG